MWLGTKQQLDKVIIKDIPLLSTVVPVVDSARNLGVSIDSQLSMDVHVAAVCRSGYYQLRQLRPLTRSLSRCCRDSSSCVHSQSIGLLQRCTVRSVWQADVSPTVSPKRCCATRDRRTAMRPHNSDLATTTLAARATERTVQDRCPRLSMSSRPSTVVLVRRLPACLWLPTAPSPVIWFTVECRSTCTQHVWWPVLCHCRAAGLELFAGWIATM